MRKVKIVWGSPTASHFFLLRQIKSSQKEGAPGLPSCRVPSISRKQAELRNSHDLRGYVLKQCLPNTTARLRLVEAAHKKMEKQVL